MTAGITIIIQPDETGLTVQHIITGNLSPQLAASACRAIADRIDRERIRAEMAAAEKENGATEE